MLSGETSIEALRRETKEELNIDIPYNDIHFVTCTTSMNKKNDEYIDNHYNECYIINLDLDISQCRFFDGEVENVKFYDVSLLEKMIDRNDSLLAEKVGPWTILKKIIIPDIKRRKK